MWQEVLSNGTFTLNLGFDSQLSVWQTYFRLRSIGAEVQGLRWSTFYGYTYPSYMVSRQPSLIPFVLCIEEALRWNGCSQYWRRKRAFQAPNHSPVCWVSLLTLLDIARSGGEKMLPMICQLGSTWDLEIKGWWFQFSCSDGWKAGKDGFRSKCNQWKWDWSEEWQWPHTVICCAGWYLCSCSWMFSNLAIVQLWPQETPLCMPRHMRIETKELRRQHIVIYCVCSLYFAYFCMRCCKDSHHWPTGKCNGWMTSSLDITWKSWQVTAGMKVLPVLQALQVLHSEWWRLRKININQLQPVFWDCEFKQRQCFWFAQSLAQTETVTQLHHKGLKHAKAVAKGSETADHTASSLFEQQQTNWAPKHNCHWPLGELTWPFNTFQGDLGGTCGFDGWHFVSKSWQLCLMQISLYYLVM